MSVTAVVASRIVDVLYGFHCCCWHDRSTHGNVHMCSCVERPAAVSGAISTTLLPMLPLACKGCSAGKDLLFCIRHQEVNGAPSLPTCPAMLCVVSL